MKPKRIIIIRHGQSESNVDKLLHTKKPDYTMRLTPDGHAEAYRRGLWLAAFLCGESAQFYVSPFWRTRDTLKEILKSFPQQCALSAYEDPRLREQEWGHIRKRRWFTERRIEDERDAYGHFYYRFPDGESCADTFDRVSDFLQTLFRDFEKANYPQNAVIVTHGMTMRLILMRWFHLSVECYEAFGNPENCGAYILVLDPKTDKYCLVTEPKKHMLKHQWQYPESVLWERKRISLNYEA